ncbi:putative effector protein [Blumeria hordei DH14]|uniref:Putative effector protein n=1 Tax=Blumeria graminis f. sp. hordei (strain DH14) TaxID=546991 RepID=N1JH14_BLUG1|nr:putative effector protein [Blumeria hordei DH14]
MKYLHQISRSQSLWIKALFLLLLSSAHASLLQRGINLSDQPGYHCKKKVYPFSEVENVRKAACNAFVSKNKRSKRPLVHTYDTEVENLIYEWKFPMSVFTQYGGKSREEKEKIIFNNNCELKDVLYRDSDSHKYEPCTIVPEASTSTNPGINQVHTETSVQCGSLSWEIKDIQRHKIRGLSQFLDTFIEVEHSSHNIDGPWKRTLLKKNVIIKQVGKSVQSVKGKNRLIILKVQNIPYEIMVNNQYEAQGIIVTHYISHKLISAVNSNGVKINPSRQKPIRDKQSIRLVCLLEKPFPLFPNEKISNEVKSLKRKSRD